VLALAVALYVVATAAGAGQPSGGGGGGPSGSGLTQSLGHVLVLPASSGDVEAVLPGCRQGGTLTVASGQACVYRLRSGFLAKRLRLSLTVGSSLIAVLEQPKPRVTDTETLDAAHTRVDLVYNQGESALRLTCGTGQKTGCAARIG
jgi:hypothetical protein